MVILENGSAADTARATLVASQVKITAISGNSKVGKVATTQVSQYTCDLLGTPCPFRHAGCYGESGLVAMTSRTLELASKSLGESVSLLDIAHAEADGIDTLKGNRPLRLHVVGDSPTDSSATIVSLAADRYTARGGQAVWTYTHGWREVARTSWGGVSVLASCETISDLDAAYAKGYALSMVVEVHGDKVKPYRLENGMLGIPCREQVGAAEDCTKCRLCFDGDKLRRSNAVILFAVHGQQSRKAKAAIERKRFIDLDSI